jgi:hypothetical protein
MFTFKEFVTEGNINKVGRVEIINARIRKGKLQRRKYISNTKGWRYDNHHHLVRMTNVERLHRKLGAMQAKRKRKAEMAQIIRRRKIALNKKRSLGYNE